MKTILATLFLSGFCYCAQAQVGPNGPNGSSGGNSDAGRSYSNGAIPNPNEQTQNRPDSTLRSSDTTYMHQQWNDGSTQKQNSNTGKRSKSSTTPKSATTPKKKNN